MKSAAVTCKSLTFVLASGISLIVGGVPVVYAADQGGIEEIVVTARYREEKLQETPIAITAITADEIEAKAFTSSYEIGYSVPNASFRPAQAAFGNTMTAYIRGIGQNDFLGAFEPGVAIYVDDVYYPFTMGSQLDLLDLERVEVLRGPQGTLQGRNSIGGAVRMVSKKAQGDNTGSIDLTGGDFDRRDVRASYDFRINDTLFARVAGVSKHQDGYQDRIDFACAFPSQSGTLPIQIPNRSKNCKLGTMGGQDVSGVRGNLRWVPNSDFEVSVITDYQNDSSEARADTLLGISHLDPTTGQLAPGAGGLYALYNGAYVIPKFGVPYDSRFLPPNPFVSYDTFKDLGSGVSFDPQTALKRWGTSGTLDWQINDAVHATTILAYSEISSRFATDADGSPINMQTVDGAEEINVKTAEIRFSGRAMDRMDWTVGGFFYRSHFDDSQTVTLPALDFFFCSLGIQFIIGHGPNPNCVPNPAPPPVFITPNFVGATAYVESNAGAFLVNTHNIHDATSEAGFGQVVYDINDQWRLTGGLRYSHDHKKVHQDNTIVIADFPLDSTHLDWRAGLDYKFNDDILLYFSASTGYRPGSYNPRPFTPDQVAQVDPEEQTAYEGGIKADLFDRRVRVNLAGFYSDYSKRIVAIGGTECAVPLDPATNPGVISDTLGNFCYAPTSLTGYTNFPATISGAEAEVTWVPVDPMTLTGTVGWTHWSSPEIDNCDFNGDGVRDLVAGTFFGVSIPVACSKRPSYVPEVNWSIGASYAFGVANGSTLTPRVDVYGQSEICFSPVSAISCTAGYELVNARVEWASPEGAWTVAGGVSNLTDKTFFLNNFDLSPFGQPTTEAQPGQPRAWYFTVGRKF